MYGVPKDLDLRRFEGATLTQICLGSFQVQFNLDQPVLQVFAEGTWEVRGPSGELVDKNMEQKEREAFRIHPLIGSRFVGYTVNSPKSLTLRFDNGWSLILVDDSEKYESFTISPGDIIV